MINFKTLLIIPTFVWIYAFSVSIILLPLNLKHFWESLNNLLFRLQTLHLSIQHFFREQFSFENFLEEFAPATSLQKNSVPFIGYFGCWEEQRWRSGSYKRGCRQLLRSNKQKKHSLSHKNCIFVTWRFRHWTEELSQEETHCECLWT